MTEHLMSIGNTQLPSIIKGVDGDKVMIMRLILMEPGLIQTHPDMGVGLVSRYRYKDVETIKAELPANVKKQIETYLPHLQEVDVNVGFITQNNKTNVTITINSNEMHSIIVVDEETRDLVSLR